MYFGYTLYEVNKWCVLYCSQPLLWQQHRGPSSSSYFSVQNSIGKAQRETHHLHKTYLATATKPTTKLLPDYWQSVVELLSYIFKRYVEAKLKHCCHTRHSVLFLSIKSDKEFLVFCLYPRLNTRFDECTQFLVSILKLALGLPRRFVNSMIFFKNSGNL